MSCRAWSDALKESLRWVVFEQASDSYFVAKFDKTTSAEAGSDVLSSGAFSYTLKAGRTYAIGVAVSGGAAVPYVETSPWSAEISFGSATGGLSDIYSLNVYGGYLNSARLFRIRLTTSLP